VVGLDLYQLPPVDFVMEAGLVMVSCLLYARAYAPMPAQRRWVAAMGLALIALQAVLDFGLAHAVGPGWHPSI
jgi:hypothetical protein